MRRPCDVKIECETCGCQFYPDNPLVTSCPICAGGGLRHCRVCQEPWYPPLIQRNQQECPRCYERLCELVPPPPEPHTVPNEGSITGVNPEGVPDLNQVTRSVCGGGRMTVFRGRHFY
jgi:hypothetical protein